MIKAHELDKWRRLMETKEEVIRVSTSKQLYKVFTHEWKDLLEARLETLYSTQVWTDLKLQSDISLNLLRWAADEQAAIYSKPPVRTIDGFDQSSQTTNPLSPYLSEGTLNLALDKAARICYACREVAIRPLVVLNDDGKGHHIVLDIVPPHRLFVVPDESDITKPSLVVIQKDDGTFVAWDKEEQVQISASWEIVSRTKNPYNVIPYVVCHATYPTVTFWQTLEALGLLEATFQTAQSKTEYNHLRRLQSHKQGWYRSDEDVPPSILSDPSSWVRLKGNAEMGVLDMVADLKENLDTLLDSAAASLALYGIRPESMRGTLDASSGYALSIKLIAQTKVWDAQRSLWEVWEPRLYSVAKSVLLVDAGVVIPHGDLRIQWADIGAQATEMDKAKLHSELLSMGVVSKQWVQREMGMTQNEVIQITEELNFTSSL